MSPRVLVVDDNKTWREQFQDSLETIGEVDTAKDFAEARRFLKRSRYDLALVDVCLDQPDFTLPCQQFFDFLHRTYPDLPVVATSGKDVYPPSMWELSRYGVVDFIYKPHIKLRRFQQRIRVALKQGAAAPELVNISEQRLRDLASHVNQDLALLKDYEEALRYEDDPRRRAKYRHQTAQLHESASRYRQEYDELRQQVIGELPTEMQEVAVQLQQMRAKLDTLLTGQTTIRDDVSHLRQTLLARYDASEQTVITTITERLAQVQLTTLHTTLDVLEADRLSEAEMHETLNAVHETLAALQQQGVSLPGQQAVAEAIDSPTLEVKHKLKVTLPIIPLLLGYEGELELGSGVNLETVWERLAAKVRGG